jgi:hypothetical protein
MNFALGDCFLLGSFSKLGIGRLFSFGIFLNWANFHILGDCFLSAVFRNWANFCLCIGRLFSLGNFSKLGEFSPIGRLFSFGSFSKLGDFFTYWAIVFFGQFFENYCSSPIFPWKKLCINFEKNGLCYILGNFLQTHLVTLFATVNTLEYDGIFLNKSCSLTLPKDLRQRGTFGGPQKKKKKNKSC